MVSGYRPLYQRILAAEMEGKTLTMEEIKLYARIDAAILKRRKDDLLHLQGEARKLLKKNDELAAEIFWERNPEQMGR